MKHKFLLFVAAALMLGSFTPVRAAEDPEFKDGYWLLKSADDMVFFATLVNSGAPNNSAKAKLIADIDMTGVNFFPIGMYASSGGTQVKFLGHFDGQGHIIKNLYQEAWDYYELGLFSRTDGRAIIENFGVVNAKIIQHRSIRAGVIGGELYNAVVRNVFTAGDITVESFLDEGAETVSDAKDHQVGGIAGESNSTTMYNCYTTFNCIVGTNSSSGPLVNCYAGEDVFNADGDLIQQGATAEQRASGELTCTLNSNPNDIHWYQKIGEDPYPLQDPARGQVYAHGDILCNGAPAEGGNCTYDYTPETNIPDHEFDEDGICQVCGVDAGYMKPAADGWWEVTNADQLRYVSRVVNGGNNSIGIRLMNDIDLIDIANFPPIGYYNDYGAQIGWHGVFDGQNHIISNLTVYVDDQQEAGLFGRINSGGTVRNLGVVNADITNAAAIRAGVIAGEIHAVTINNVFTAGEINITTEHSQKGGISGEAASSTLNNCYSTFDGPIANAPGTLNNCFGGAFETAPTGELCWNINGKSFRAPIYYQKIGEDEFPVLDSSHGVVYKADEEEYKTALTPEDFNEITGLMLAQEKASLEGMKASANLIAAYSAELDKLTGLPYDEFLAAYDALGAMREALANSEAAYKAYMDKVAEVSEYLNTHDDFAGEDRQILEDYLNQYIEAGANELYPNGTYAAIIENCQLNNNAVKIETAFVQQMLETAIANGYMPGSDITKKLVNPDFADGLNGWTITGHLEASGDYGNTHARLIRDYNSSISQTLTDMKPGLYEFQMSSYSELYGWTQVATYNYTSFITGNGLANYGKTQGAELMSEEIYETLGDAEKGNLSAVMDESEIDVVLGYKPANLVGVAIMFDRGVWNNRILAYVGEDGELTVGMDHEGFKSRQTDLFVANARLAYLGELSSEFSTAALDATLADMVAAANHIVNDYAADYFANGATDAPNFTKSLADELKAAVAAAESAADNQAKYQVVQTFGDIFQRIWESKKLYAELAQLNESVMKTCEDVLGETNPNAYRKFVEETYEPNIDTFEKGEATNAEVEAKIEELKNNDVYLLQQGEEPELVDGFYQITNAYNLIWFSNQSNNNGKNGDNSLNAVLVNDIDMTPAGNFTPIALHRDDVDWDGDGTKDGVGIGTVYKGIFDGQGHVIKNLKITEYEGCEAGFFSRCQKATVRNLGFENANIQSLRTYADGTAGIRAGILAGEFYQGMLENCWATGDLVIETIHDQKGLCGEAAQSTLRGCWTTYETLANAAGAVISSFGGIDVEELNKNGALCFLLNGDQSVISWYQTLGEDKYPTLDATHKQVYQHGGLFCDGSPKPETTFDNVEGEYVADNHEFDENGICTLCGYDAGTITPVDGWYEISNPYQLRWFAKFVNAGNTGASARLTADIDLENKLFFPIGIYSDAGSYQGYGNCAYTGTFDGQGHIISNLNVEGEGNVELALFSRCTGGARILNLGIENARVVNTHPNDGKRIGVIAGEFHGSQMHNCFVVGNIELQTTHSQKAAFAGEAAANGETPTIFYNCYTSYETFSNQGQFVNCFGKKQVKDASGNVVIAAIPEGALESGELCYAINQGEFTTPTWFQTLGEDKYPVLDNTHKIVYRNDDGTYTNERKGLAQYDGTEENPFRIENVQQFCQLIDYMHPGQMNYVVLENDLDMNDVETWIPINCDQAVANYQNFIHFDGQNHVIKNFHPTNTDQSYQSIFGIMCGTVKNLGVEDADVNCPNSGTGILCAWIGRTATFSGISYVDHCWVTGKLTCKGYAGALSGHIEGEAYVRNCYANAAIVSESSVTGGIIGRVRGKLQMDNVYAAGSHNHGGGIIGGGQQAATPACTYNNIVVWNNYFENFGETAIADKMTNISYYNNTNFAELQKTVVAWDSSVWSCGMGEGEYPVLIGTGATSIAMPKLNIDNTIYTLTGVKVGNDMKKLQKGIYIVNGKKVLVK